MPDMASDKKSDSESERVFISAYFDDWEKTLDKVDELSKIEDQKYCLESILILSCYIGAFSAERYPGEKTDWEKYTKILLEYSGERKFYEQIDSLF